MGLFDLVTGVTKLALTPVTVAADVLTLGEVGFMKGTYDAVDTILGPEKKQPVHVHYTQSQAAAPSTSSSEAELKKQVKNLGDQVKKLEALTTREQKFAEHMAKNNFIEPAIIAEKDYGHVFVRWSKHQVHFYYTSMGYWLNMPPKPAC